MSLAPSGEIYRKIANTKWSGCLMVFLDLCLRMKVGVILLYCNREVARMSTNRYRTKFNVFKQVFHENPLVNHNEMSTTQAKTAVGNNYGYDTIAISLSEITKFIDLRAATSGRILSEN